MTCAPWFVSTRDMSGKADSKQTSTPTSSGLMAPAGLVTVSVCAPVPGIMLEDAALLILVSQLSCCLNGMYSPNGTRRVFTYRPWMPCGLTRTATFSWPPSGPGSVESWLTRISAWAWADSFSMPPSSAGSSGQVVGDARLAPDDQVGMILRERAPAAELPGQGL